MSGPIISLSGVQKYYGDYHALRDIELDIAEGEFFSLLGPSGCGKTTLLRTIAGFEDASDGALMLGGRDMKGVPPNKRPTNMVFQSYAIFPHLNVAENVAFGLRKHGLSAAQKDAKVAEALAMVGLEGYGQRAAHALSGGQRQRVALRARSSFSPRCFCWMSRSRPSTKRCANKCRGSFGAFSARWASPSFWSRTTKKKRSSCPTASR